MKRPLLSGPIVALMGSLDLVAFGGALVGRFSLAVGQ
jgi:hypothetical protein